MAAVSHTCMATPDHGIALGGMVKSLIKAAHTYPSQWRGEHRIAKIFKQIGATFKSEENCSKEH